MSCLCILGLLSGFVGRFLNDPIGTDKEGSEIALMDVLCTDADEVPDIVATRCEQERLYKKIQCLGQRERKVVELRYGLPHGGKKTQREIAGILGISRSYVSRIEKRALNKLFQYLSADRVCK